VIVVAAVQLAFADNPEVPPRDLVSFSLPTDQIHRNPPAATIGSVRVHRIEEGDTFLDIARRQDLGYNEVLAANPGVDPWLPAVGSEIILPTEWLLPSGPRDGLVVNVPEMRLYFFYPGPAANGSTLRAVSYPVGLGRDEWRTPIAEFKVRGKTKNPTWVLPEDVKAERIAEKGFAEVSIPGGDPENPLGRHRIELTLGAYAIHGTNKNWGVGMQVSHGCVRLYPEDIGALFPLVQAGTKGRFVYEPVKFGVVDGRPMMEVHPDIYGLLPNVTDSALSLVRTAGVEEVVDFGKLKAAVEAASGIPTDVGYSHWPTHGH
jgi:L,D-transpeptidase ErfK/SrfK